MVNKLVKIRNYDFVPNIHQIDALKMNDLYLWSRAQGGKISYWGKFRLFSFWISYFQKDTDFIQLSLYQIYCELFMFFIVFIISKLTISTVVGKFILPSLTSFMMYGIKPMFYFNGDVNFRRRAHQQGIWKALKKEFFPDHTEI